LSRDRQSIRRGCWLVAETQTCPGFQERSAGDVGTLGTLCRALVLPGSLALARSARRSGTLAAHPCLAFLFRL
jgi:hypothetical protein